MNFVNESMNKRENSFAYRNSLQTYSFNPLQNSVHSNGNTGQFWDLILNPSKLYDYIESGRASPNTSRFYTSNQIKADIHLLSKTLQSDLNNCENSDEDEADDLFGVKINCKTASSDKREKTGEINAFSIRKMEKKNINKQTTNVRSKINSPEKKISPSGDAKQSNKKADINPYVVRSRINEETNSDSEDSIFNALNDFKKRLNLRRKERNSFHENYNLGITLNENEKVPNKKRKINEYEKISLNSSYEDVDFLPKKKIKLDLKILKLNKDSPKHQYFELSNKNRNNLSLISSTKFQDTQSNENTTKSQIEYLENNSVEESQVDSVEKTIRRKSDIIDASKLQNDNNLSKRTKNLSRNSIDQKAQVNSEERMIRRSSLRKSNTTNSSKLQNNSNPSIVTEKLISNSIDQNYQVDSVEKTIRRCSQRRLDIINSSKLQNNNDPFKGTEKLISNTTDENPQESSIGKNKRKSNQRKSDTKSSLKLQNATEKPTIKAIIKKSNSCRKNCMENGIADKTLQNNDSVVSSGFELSKPFSEMIFHKLQPGVMACTALGLNNITCGYICIEKYDVLIQKTSSNIVFLVLSGEITVVQNQETQSVQAGAFFFIPKDFHFSLKNHSAAEVRISYFKCN
uniref:Uncharacterized protein n=1 Tax=Clastoptera arizonana TaxID=38151 RepID=A0A1B6C4U3_9HEMI